MAIIKKLAGMPAPRFGKHCYFSEGAVIVGDVEMGDDCTVWFNAVLRGDVHFIKIGDRTNVQDNSCIHTLNGSALALPRIVAAILENNQTPEGIRVPKALVPYCGFDMIDDKNF